MSTLKVSFNLSEAARKKQFAATGVRPPEQQFVEFDIEEATVEQRQRLLMSVELERFDSKRGILLKAYMAVEAYSGNYIKQARMVLDFPPADIDALLRILGDAAVEHDRCAEQVAEWDVAVKARQAKADEEKTIRATRDAEDKAKRIAAKKEREAAAESWIAEHGSDHLQGATDRGYNCDRLYQFERATQEYPDFELDYDDRAEWTSRSCPSADALAQVARIEQAHPGTKVNIVWLTKPVFSGDAESDIGCNDYEIALYDFTEREAITVNDPNFTRDLVK